MCTLHLNKYFILWTPLTWNWKMASFPRNDDIYFSREWYIPVIPQKWEFETLRNTTKFVGRLELIRECSPIFSFKQLWMIASTTGGFFALTEKKNKNKCSWSKCLASCLFWSLLWSSPNECITLVSREDPWETVWFEEWVEESHSQTIKTIILKYVK